MITHKYLSHLNILSQLTSDRSNYFVQQWMSMSTAGASMDYQSVAELDKVLNDVTLYYISCHQTNEY